jgi:N-acetylmuramate 1-kinase
LKRPPPEDLLPWGLAELGLESPGLRVQLSVIAGDASNRRYFRLAVGSRSYILVEAPPHTEKNAEFLAVRELLERGGLVVPELLGADLTRGYLLLGDLGDRLLLSELSQGSADDCYQRAFLVLRQLGRIDTGDPAWPSYDHALLSEELGRFPHWFAQAMLGHSWTEADERCWEPLAKRLIESALEQPRVLVHRDFHSRNLMPQPDGSLAVIDFQDAVLGPVTYDLVSLLRDCYISWPPEQVKAWALDYHHHTQGAGELPGVSPEQFLQWFDLMGLQRHLKVLGTFARLYLRDGKQGYLDDLPQVLHYVEAMLTRYAPLMPEIENFAQWFALTLKPLISTQPWSEAR